MIIFDRNAAQIAVILIFSAAGCSPAPHIESKTPARETPSNPTATTKPGVLPDAKALEPRTTAEAVTLEQKIAALEQNEIRKALAETDGNKSQAAEKLGLSRQGLLNKINRYGLE